MPVLWLWSKIGVPSCIVQLAGANVMSKEHKPSRETKKKAALTPKEKKAAKRAKKQGKSGFSIG